MWSLQNHILLLNFLCIFIEGNLAGNKPRQFYCLGLHVGLFTTSSNETVIMLHDSWLRRYANKYQLNFCSGAMFQVCSDKVLVEVHRNGKSDTVISVFSNCYDVKTGRLKWIKIN